MRRSDPGFPIRAQSCRGDPRSGVHRAGRLVYISEWQMRDGDLYAEYAEDRFPSYCSRPLYSIFPLSVIVLRVIYLAVRLL